MILLRQRLGVCGLLVGLCLRFGSTGYCHSGTRLEGRVSDLSGGAIPNATVTLFSDDRVRTTKTDADGEFLFASLPPVTRYLEVSSNGFFSVSIPITDATPERVSVTLWVGEGSGCPPYTFDVSPSAAYEERSSKVQLAGSVGDTKDVSLAYAHLSLVKANLDARQARWPDSHRIPAMKERFFKEGVVAELTTNEKGEYQFSSLEPGWYTLIAAHDGYYDGSAKFWIARDNLTRPSRIRLVPVSAPANCGESIPIFPASR